MTDQSFTTPPDLSTQIQQAAQAISRGDTSAAKRIVAELIKTRQDSADVWYLYAFLIDDPTKKQVAVDKALAIDPEHTRARQLAESIKSDSLVGDLFGAMPTAAPQQSAMHYQPPPITVNVNQDNHANVSATAMAGNVMVAPRINQIAMIVGVVGAFFFGIFGLAHLVNGKFGGAILYFFAGLAWLFVAFLGIALTAGIGACLVLPLHFYLAYSWSKKGATI